MASISQQLTELRSQQDSMKQEIANVVARVSARFTAFEEKVASLGEVDPDLQPDIDAMKADVELLKNIAAETPAPEPPVEPTPVEPSPEEPGA